MKTLKKNSFEREGGGGGDDEFFHSKQLAAGNSSREIYLFYAAKVEELSRKKRQSIDLITLRAYLLSSLLNLISRRGRSLVNHSVFRDSSSFHSTWNG